MQTRLFPAVSCLFEVKSGKSLYDEFTRNMRKFRERYTSHVTSIEDNSVLGTVICNGETYASCKDFAYFNYRETENLFESREKPFSLANMPCCCP